MEIKPIRTSEDHAEALKAIEQLWDAEDAGDLDKLEVLAVLVDEYERRHFPIPDPEPDFVAIPEVHIEKGIPFSYHIFDTDDSPLAENDVHAVHDFTRYQAQYKAQRSRRTEGTVEPWSLKEAAGLE